MGEEQGMAAAREITMAAAEDTNAERGGAVSLSVIESTSLARHVSQQEMDTSSASNLPQWKI